MNSTLQASSNSCLTHSLKTRLSESEAYIYKLKCTIEDHKSHIKGMEKEQQHRKAEGEKLLRKYQQERLPAAPKKLLKPAEA